jgi:hypothetical protein
MWISVVLCMVQTTRIDVDFQQEQNGGRSKSMNAGILDGGKEIKAQNTNCRND